MLCSQLVQDRVVSPNQGFVFTQLKVEPRLLLLLVDLDSQLGHATTSVLERKFSEYECMYLVNVSKTRNEEDSYYLRKLGVTVLPEFREYNQGHLTCSLKGLDRITYFVSSGGNSSISLR